MDDDTVDGIFWNLVAGLEKVLRPALDTFAQFGAAERGQVATYPEGPPRMPVVRRGGTGPQQRGRCPARVDPGCGISTFAAGRPPYRRTVR